MAAASKAGADMTAGRNSGAAGIVALALEFHRAPTHHADLLHGHAPLPSGVGVLLKLAGGSEPEPEAAALAPPQELQAASLFFIEQVLFRHDSDHYRLLGVEPGASADQIKEHHRLLMRVFHPDRENRADDWKDAFATRINLAYTALRDPHTRRDYDATLIPAARPGAKLPAVRRASASRPKPASPRSRRSSLPPLLLRYLPQWVLAGSALVAVMVVGAVYLNNPRAPAAQQRAVARVAEDMRQDIAPDILALNRQRAAVEDPLQPAAVEARAPTPLRASAPAPTLRPEPVVEAAMAPPRSGSPHRADTRPARVVRSDPPAPAAAPTPSITPAALPRPPEIAVIEAAAHVELVQPPVRSAPPPAPAPAQPEPHPAEAAPPAQPDPDATLAQFMASFERGDTQAFMALFDEVAIGRAGGKQNIRREHESLFRSTELRHIAIDGMAWVREGDWIRGEGRYRKTLMRKGELVLRTETGVFRIQLVRHGDQALIMGLDLQPGGRS
jgi:hypothetical protein